MRGIIKGIASILTVVIFSTLASAVTVNDIIQKLEKNADKVKDMQADVEIKITFEGKGTSPEMNRTQVMKLYTKGKDKMRMEMQTPTEQTIIMNKSKMLMEYSDPMSTKGEKTRQIIDRDSMPNLQSMSTPTVDLNTTFADMLKKSDTKIISSSGDFCTFSVIPENAGPLMQKVELTIDSKKGIITKQKMFSNLGVSVMNMQYQKVGDIWILSQINMTSPVGATGEKMKMVSTYKNIKINKGVSESKFIIKE